MSTARRALRNIVSLMMARPLSWAAAFIASVWLVRYLGKEKLGMLDTALGFVALFGYISDFGTQHFVIREVSRDRSTAGAYLNNFLSAQVLFGAFLMVTMVLVVNVVGKYTFLVKQAVYLAGLGLVVTSMSAPFKAVFHAHEAIHISAFLGVVLALTEAVLKVGGIFSGCGVQFFAAISIISGLTIVGISYMVCRRWFVVPRLGKDVHLWWRMLKMSFPFALFMGATVIYNRIDIQMLYAMKGESAVGYYSAVVRLLNPLLLPAQAVMMAMYPVLSRRYVGSVEKFRFTAEKTLKYVAALGVPMAVGVFLFSDRIVPLLYGQGFRASVGGLEILSWTLATRSLTLVLTFSLAASGKVLMLAGVNGVAAVANVGLNLLLIPRYSFRGAAMATVACELCVLVALVVYSRRSRSAALPWVDAGKVISAALVMTGFVLLCRSSGLLVVVPVAAVIYFGVLFLLRFVKREEKDFLRSALQRSGSPAEGKTMGTEEQGQL